MQFPESICDDKINWSCMKPKTELFTQPVFNMVEISLDGLICYVTSAFFVSNFLLGCQFEVCVLLH